MAMSPYLSRLLAKRMRTVTSEEQQWLYPLFFQAEEDNAQTVEDLPQRVQDWLKS